MCINVCKNCKYYEGSFGLLPSKCTHELSVDIIEGGNLSCTTMRIFPCEREGLLFEEMVP